MRIIQSFANEELTKLLNSNDKYKSTFSQSRKDFYLPSSKLYSKYGIIQAEGSDSCNKIICPIDENQMIHINIRRGE